VPIKIIDIAGLVPDAHLGKGLGNQFLSDIMEAQAIIHVVDASGGTDINGNAVAPGTHDPREDVNFFTKELDYWILSIIKKMIKSRVELKKEDFIQLLSKQLSGLGIKPEDVDYAVSKTNLKSNSDDSKFLEFIEILRQKSKPIVVAANKADVPEAEKNLGIGIPCSAEAEYALRRAAERGIVDYLPGDSDFKIIDENIDEKQKKALEFIHDNVLKKLGSTGVQNVIDKTVFSLLNMIVVYPVENETRLTDKKGNILPDAHLMKRGSTALDLAYRVHEDIGKKFIAAVNCKNGKHVSASYELQDGDVISIKAGR
jgi:ribosome-binding ATPase YchF (GTP1/OBG family)